MAAAFESPVALPDMRSEHKNVELTESSLAGVRFFAGLSFEQRDELLPHCRGTIYRPKTEILHHRGGGDDVYFIVSGRVQATVFSAAGKVITFQELREGDMFGELTAIDQSLRSASIITITECFVIKIAGASFRDLISRYPVLSAALLQRLCGLVRFLCGRVLEFHTLTVADRVRAEILRLARAEAGTDNVAVLSPTPTHAEISHRAGTHREAVTRTLGTLTRDGLVEKRGSALVVRDVQALSDLVEQVVGEPFDG